MRPKPFDPVQLEGGSPFVRDAGSGLVWHRVFNRTLYADTDRSQVVYHANYLRYFEMGRASLMRDAGYPYRKVEAAGYVYPVVEMGITFHQPLSYDDPMWIHTRPVRLERVRVGFDYVVTNAESGVLVCTGFTIHCAVGRSGRPVAVDPDTVKMFRGFPV